MSASLPSPTCVLLPATFCPNGTSSLTVRVTLQTWYCCRPLGKSAEYTQGGGTGLSLLFFFAPSDLRISSLYAYGEYTGLAPLQHAKMTKSQDVPPGPRLVGSGEKHFPKVGYELKAL